MIPGSSVLVAPNGTERITTWGLVDNTGAIVHGVTAQLLVRRTSDNKVMDWSTNTFVSSGWVTPAQAMAEVSLTGIGGIGVYAFDWNLASIVNPNANDVYQVWIDQDSPSTAVNVHGMFGEIRVWGPHMAAAAAALLGTTVPGAYGAGTAGKALGYADAAISAVPNAVVGQTVVGAPANSLGSDVHLSRQLLRNRKLISGQNLLVYADDGVTVMFTIPLKDVSGGPIAPAAGDPAQFGP